MPAMVSSFFGTGAETIPVPRGAGMRRTKTEPHLPRREKKSFSILNKSDNGAVSIEIVAYNLRDDVH